MPIFDEVAEDSRVEQQAQRPSMHMPPHPRSIQPRRRCRCSAGPVKKLLSVFGERRRRSLSAAEGCDDCRRLMARGSTPAFHWNRQGAGLPLPGSVRFWSHEGMRREGATMVTTELVAEFRTAERVAESAGGLSGPNGARQDV